MELFYALLTLLLFLNGTITASIFEEDVCGIVLPKMKPCLEYIKDPPNKSSPSLACCQKYSHIHMHDAPCLCYLIDHHSLLDFQLNTTRIFSLLPDCFPEMWSQDYGSSLEIFCKAPEDSWVTTTDSEDFPPSPPSPPSPPPSSPSSPPSSSPPIPPPSSTSSPPSSTSSPPGSGTDGNHGCKFLPVIGLYIICMFMHL